MPLTEINSIKLKRRAFIAGAAISLPITFRRSAQAAAISFSVSDFGIDDEEVTGSFGRGINRKATAVGITTSRAGARAVRTSGRALRHLSDNGKSGIANAINDSGLIVGSVGDLAASWTDDILSMLPELGSETTAAYGVNSEGAIVGSADSGANSSIAVAWSGSEVTNLPSLGGPTSRAVSINRDGIIVGYSTLDDEGSIVRAVRWLDGNITDLGTIGGKISEAVAINSTGDIVGCSTADAGFSAVDHAFLFRNDSMIMLPRLEPVKIAGRSTKVKLDRSRASCITDAGDICGFSMSVSENDPISIATVWFDEAAIDLNTLIGKAAKEIVLTTADGINADRELVCTGFLIGDESRSRLFRLHPE